MLSPNKDTINLDNTLNTTNLDTNTPNTNTTNLKKNLEKFTYRSLKSFSKNTKCFICSSVSPDWANVSFAIYLCLQCAGLHRSHGASVSKVKSVFIDTWVSDINYDNLSNNIGNLSDVEKSLELKRMGIGGNERLKIYLEEFCKEFITFKNFGDKNLSNSNKNEDSSSFIVDKQFFFSKKAETYKKILTDELYNIYNIKTPVNSNNSNDKNVKVYRTSSGGFSFDQSQENSNSPSYSNNIDGNNTTNYINNSSNNISNSSKAFVNNLMDSKIVTSLKNYDYKDKAEQFSKKTLKFIKGSASFIKSKSTELKKKVSEKYFNSSNTNNNINNTNNRNSNSYNNNSSSNINNNEDEEDTWN